MATSNPINHRLLANFQDEPRQMIQPIKQYAKEPLLPLRQACEPLKDIVDEDLTQNIEIALMNARGGENGLTKEESAALHLYTMEWEVSEKSLYAVLNRTLRAVNRQALIPWHKYLKLLLTAFFKLP